MREALSNVLGEEDSEDSVTRILAAAFFRKRPLQLGSSAAHVVSLVGRTPAGRDEASDATKRR